MKGFSGSDVDSQVSLQSLLASQTSSYESPPPNPHHPLACRVGPLYYVEGVLACDHVEVGPNDRRTDEALRHSMAILIIECAEAL